MGGPVRAARYSKSSLLLASAFAGRFRLGHPFGHLCLHRVKVETRAPLHWGVLKEGLEFLAHHLLDENKTPEFILEPLEVCLAAFLRSAVGPGCTLERIEAQINQNRHVPMGLF